MAANDIYQVDLVQRYGTGGEPTRNVFFYVGLIPAATAELVGDEFVKEGGVLETLNAVQCTYIKNDTLRVINLFSLTDFHERDLSGTGADGTGVLPIHDAISMTFKLDTRGVRPGGKRFVGLSETAVTNSIIDGSGHIPLINDLADVLTEPLLSGAFDMAKLVVPKRILVAADEPAHGAYYRLPETEEEADYGTVVAVLVNMRISHQVSRGNSR